MTNDSEDWQATPEQTARAKRFEDWLLVYVESMESSGNLREHRGSYGGNQAFLSALQASELGLDRAELERCVTDYFVHPLLHARIPNTRHAYDPWKSRAEVSFEWLEFAVLQIGADYAFQQVLARLQFQLHHPRWSKEKDYRPEWIAAHRRSLSKLHPMLAREEKTGLDRIGSLLWNAYLAPDPQCLGLLVAQLAKTPQHAQAWLDVVSDPALPLILPGYQDLADLDQWPCPYPMTTAIYLQAAHQADDIALEFARLNYLGPEQVRILLRLEPPRQGYLLHACITQREGFEGYSEVAAEFLYQLSQQSGEHALVMLGDRAVSCGRNDARQSGARFLLAAVRLIAELSEPPPPYAIARQSSDKQAEAQAAGLSLLCNLKSLAPDESIADVVSALKLSPRKHLEALFAHAGAHARTVLMALDFADAVPLFDLVAANMRQDADHYVDRQAWLHAYQQAGKHAESALKLWRSTKLYGRSVKRLDAALGRVEKSFDSYVHRLSQEHLRLLGLLPITDANQLRERFDVLKRAAKDAAKKFGNERTQNVRDAVACGLENLARTGGYADATELEWALEARLNQNDLKVDYDGYELDIQLHCFQPVLGIRKGGKALKALPPALKKVPDVAILLGHFQAFKQQSARFRSALEQSSVTGRNFALTRVQAMLELPLLASMLGTLVCIDDRGVQGLLTIKSGGTLSLVDQHQQAHAVSGALRIAHVFDLLKAGSLSTWQQTFVEGKLVQPFKQVFRECYVLTPAERELRTRSARFSGRRVISRVAAAIFTARGWRLEGGEGSWVARRHLVDRAQQTCHLQIDLPEVYHYLSEEEYTVLGDVECYLLDQVIPLDQIPDAAFSECMRDPDLIITAGAADSDQPSQESQERRIELVQKLIPTLGLSNVTVESHFALIKGRRATYRLHLGTAVIHLQPAGYLCVVPADKVPRRDFALPFVDEDRRTSEVLAKLVMLSADHAIKDKSILLQLHLEQAHE